MWTANCRIPYTMTLWKATETGSEYKSAGEMF